MNDSQPPLDNYLVLASKDVGRPTIEALCRISQHLIGTKKVAAKGNIAELNTEFIISTDFKFCTVGSVSGYIFSAKVIRDGTTMPVTIVAGPSPPGSNGELTFESTDLEKLLAKTRRN